MGRPPVYRGDGCEYLLMTRSLATQGDLWISVGELGVFQRKDSPWQFVRIQPGQYPLMKGSDGHERCLHPPAVAALVVPFYWLCNWISPDGGFWRCYTVFGLWAVLVGWYLLAWFWERCASPLRSAGERLALRVLAAAVILFSPIGIYSYWSHSEAGVFLLLGLYFYWLERNYPVPAAVALGIAAAQNPVCILWGVLLLAKVFAVWRQKEQAAVGAGRLLRNLVALAVLPLPLLVVGIHSYRLYGVFSLLPRHGSGIASLISVGRTLRFFIDPFFGLIWFYPWIFLGLFVAKRWRAFLVRLAVSVPIAALSAAVLNINSQMVGLRYLVFVYPAFLFLPFSFPRRWMGRAALVVYAALCLAITQPFVFQRAQAENFLGALGNKAFWGLELTFRTLPALYNPEPECFAENVFHSESWKAGAMKTRVNRTCWFVYADKNALPPGKAALILTQRGGAHGGDMTRAKFGINRCLKLRDCKIEKHGEDYRLDFTVGPDDYLKLASWPDYLYLKFDHSDLKPFAIELPDGQITNL